MRENPFFLLFTLCTSNKNSFVTTKEINKVLFEPVPFVTLCESILFSEIDNGADEDSAVHEPKTHIVEMYPQYEEEEEMMMAAEDIQIGYGNKAT